MLARQPPETPVGGGVRFGAACGAVALVVVAGGSAVGAATAERAGASVVVVSGGAAGRRPQIRKAISRAIPAETSAVTPSAAGDPSQGRRAAGGGRVGASGPGPGS